MGIISLTVDVAGQVGNQIGGVVPRRVAMVTTDNLATITAAGYLNNVQREMAVAFIPTDVISCWYGYSSVNSPGTFAQFTMTFSNGVITMVQVVNPGDVLLPVVSGDVAIFNGTTGQIKDSAVAFSNGTDTVAPLFHGTATAGDFVTVNNANKTIQDSGAAPSAASQPFVVMSPGSLTSSNFPQLNDANGTLNTGKAPSDGTKSFVVMSPGSLTINHIAQIADANGTIKDGGVLGTAAAKAASDNTKATLASVSAATVLGNLSKFADTAGTVADQGVAMKSVAQAAVAGGAAAQTVTDAFCTSASCVIGSWNDTTNAVSIQEIAAGNGSFIVTSSGDPGASHLNYVIFK